MDSGKRAPSSCSVSGTCHARRHQQCAERHRHGPGHHLRSGLFERPHLRGAQTGPQSGAHRHLHRHRRHHGHHHRLRCEGHQHRHLQSPRALPRAHRRSTASSSPAPKPSPPKTASSCCWPTGLATASASPLGSFFSVRSARCWAPAPSSASPVGSNFEPCSVRRRPAASSRSPSGCWSSPGIATGRIGRNVRSARKNLWRHGHE